MTKVLMFTLVLAGISGLSSCKDYEEDKLNDIEIGFGNDLSQLKTQLESAVSTLQTELQTQQGNTDAQIANIQTAINALEDAIALCNANHVDKEDYEADKEAIYAAIQVVDEKLAGYVTLEEFNDFKNQVVDELALVKARAEFAANWIENYGEFVESLPTQLFEIWTQLNELLEQVDANTEAIKELQKLVDRVNAIENALDSLITGIIVQGTNNPVFGEFALPNNTRSNVLMAFYGTSMGAGEFPTYVNGDVANYIWNAQALTDKEWEMLNNVETIDYASGANLVSDNAGQIYVTINPTGVNFGENGIVLGLENSQAKDAGMELQNIRKSDKVLTFGYTRASEESSNGFYEADAVVTDINNVQKIDLDVAGFKAIAKDLVTDVKHFDYVQAASTVYEQFNGVLDANAVKTSYVDYNGDSRSVYSNYVVAATAVKPLSYGFAKDFAGGQHLPGFDRAENLLDRLVAKATNLLVRATDKVENKFIDKITTALRDKLDHIVINNINVSLPTLTESTLGQFVYEVKYDINKEFVYDNHHARCVFAPSETVSAAYTTAPATISEPVFVNEEGNWYLWIPVEIDINDDDTYAGTTDINGNLLVMKVPVENGDVPATYNSIGLEVDEATFSFKTLVDFSGAINDLWGNTTIDLGDTNTMLAQVQDLIDYINNILGKANNFSVVWEKGADKVLPYLHKVFEKADEIGVRVLNSAIARLQPVLVVESAGNAHIGVNAVNYPTVVESTTVHLIPTSFTYEMLTPAYKKHVACVNVMKNGKSAQGGDAELKAELQSVNEAEGMNEVIPGDTRAIELELKSGYTYQFAYSALDYSGKICTKRAVISVK